MIMPNAYLANWAAMQHCKQQRTNESTIQ